MNRMHTDHTLREALYGLYAALFEAHKKTPSDFHNGRLTTIMTGIMGVENLGWRVVGITREALEILAANEFKLPSRTLCRGHITDRSATARKLFDGATPLPLDEFFDLFLHADRTVIMTNDQNKVKGTFPEYIEIDNPKAELFSNGSMMGWKHRKKEREFLRELHESQMATQGRTLIR